jgi:uncharacterized delta-60 repeat protein
MKKVLIVLIGVLALTSTTSAFAANEKAKLGPCVKQCVQRFNPGLADSGAEEFLITDFSMQECVDACNVSIIYGECYIWEDDCCVLDYVNLDPDCGELPVDANCSEDQQCITDSCLIEEGQSIGICNEADQLIGTLDPTFGTGGVARFDGGDDDAGWGMILQSDDKALVTGFSLNGTYRDLVLLRFNSDGTLDATFGSSGMASYDGGDDDVGRSVAIQQSDGKAIVAGWSDKVSSPFDDDLLLLRYNVEGTLDTTFGIGGVVRYDNGGKDWARSVTLQTDDKVLVTGHSNNGTDDDLILLRYNDNGELDTTFGTGGIVRYDEGYEDTGLSVTLQSDGKVLVAGGSWAGTLEEQEDIVLLRFNTDGTLDTTFGTGGVARYDGGNYDEAYSVFFQSDGKLYVAGDSHNGTDVDIVLLKYNSNGTLDTTFGVGGVATYNGGGDWDYGNSVVIQSDGKAIVAGRSGNGTNIDILLVRIE